MKLNGILNLIFLSFYLSQTQWQNKLARLYLAKLRAMNIQTLWLIFLPHRRRREREKPFYNVTCRLTGIRHKRPKNPFYFTYEVTKIQKTLFLFVTDILMAVASTLFSSKVSDEEENVL
jgi:hypothetical protein